MGELWDDENDFPDSVSDFYGYGFYDGFFYSFVRNVKNELVLDSVQIC